MTLDAEIFEIGTYAVARVDAPVSFSADATTLRVFFRHDFADLEDVSRN